MFRLSPVESTNWNGLREWRCTFELGSMMGSRQSFGSLVARRRTGQLVGLVLMGTGRRSREYLVVGREREWATHEFAFLRFVVGGLRSGMSAGPLMLLLSWNVLGNEELLL